MSIKLPTYLRLACSLLIIILISYILSELQIVIIPVLFAIIFSVMLFPAAQRLEKWGLTKGLAAFIIVILASTIIGWLMYKLSAQIFSFINDSRTLTLKANDLIDKMQSYIMHKFNIDKSNKTFQLKQQVARLTEISSASLMNIFSFTSVFIANVVLIPLYVFFFLYYRHFFMEFFYKVFALQNKELIDETFQKIYDVVHNWLLGLLFVISIVGSLNSFALLIIGVQNPFFFGFLASFLLIIPYVGIIIGSLIPALVALITMDNPANALAVILVFKLIQIIESNLITPNIVGSRVSLNPFISVVMLLLLGRIFGFSGLILALPLTAILKVIFDTVNDLKPYGFLLGQPKHYHLRKHSFNYITRLKNLTRFKSKVDKQKNTSPEL